MKKYKYLLFDVDMTLLDFKKSEKFALKNTVEYFGHEFNEDILKIYATINQNYWEKYEKGEVKKEILIYARFADFLDTLDWAGDKNAWEDFYQNSIGETAFVIDGAEEVLETLYQKYPLYVISNGTGKTQRSRLKNANLLKYFRYLFISEELGVQKPEKAFFEKVLNTVDKNKSDFLVIGDSLTSDVLGANNSGLDVCWYNFQKIKNSKYDITYEISSLPELIKLLS